MGDYMDRGIMVDVTGESAATAHSKSLMMGLNELRCADKLLDITLLVENISMKAHRVVLAACSDYFTAMFTDPMRESKQSEIKLIGVTARGMQILLEYAYTSKLNLDRNNIQDILGAATHVQMNEVVDACSDFLESQIDLENCCDIAAIADLYALGKLKNKTYRFICSRLEEFSKTPEMNNLTSEQLEFILICDYPVDCSEAKVLQIVAEYCVEKKLDLEMAQRLFSKIRFSQIKNIDLRVWPRFDHIEESAHAPYYNVMRVAGFQQKKARKKKYGYGNEFDAHSTNVLINMRGMELAIVKIGGFHTNGLHNQISFALPNDPKWHDLTVIPHIEQCNYGTTVLGNDLFIVGGAYDVCLKEYIHGFGFRYSAEKNKWTTIAPIISDRCRFSLNAVGKFLYAVGGVYESVDEIDNSLGQMQRTSNSERYNPQQDSWDYISPLRENRSQHAGASMGHYLYISGGIDHHLVLSSLWRYNVYEDRWQKRRHMPCPRADHVLLSIEDRLYACGGWYEATNTEQRVLIQDIDVYDPRTDSWYLEARNPVPTFHAGITALNTKIYFVGGLLSDETINCSSNVQTYDIVTKEWSTYTDWESAKPTWECACATFFVPRSRQGI